MDLLAAKLIVTAIIVGLLLMIVGVVCGACTGFKDNWALGVAVAGLASIMLAAVTFLVSLLVKIWA